MIIKVEAIVREEKCEAVMEALEDLQVNGLTVSRVEGYGAQRGSDNWTECFVFVFRFFQQFSVFWILYYYFFTFYYYYGVNLYLWMFYGLFLYL